VHRRKGKTKSAVNLVSVTAGLRGIGHLLLIFAAFLLFFPWFVDASQMYLHLYNSDVVQPFLLLADMFEDMSAVLTWYHSPSLYVFPDWVLSGILVAMDWPGKTLPLFYACLMFTLYAFTGGYSLSVVTGISQPVTAWLIAILLILGGQLVLLSDIPRISAYIYVIMGAPFIHTGALLISLWAPGLFLRSLQAANAGTPLVLLLGIVFLGTFSDLMLGVWFVLPAIMTGGLYYWAVRESRTLCVTLGLGLAAIAGFLIESNLHTVREKYLAANVHTATESLPWLAVHTDMGLTDGDYPALLVLGFSLVLLLRGAFLLQRLIRLRNLSQRQLLEMLLAGMLAAGVLAPVVTGMLASFSTLRYWMIAYLLVPLWVMILTLQWLQDAGVLGRRYLRVTWYSIAVLGLAFYLFLFMPRAVAIWKRMTVDHSLVSCLKREGVDAGFADYWNAKFLMLLSNGSVHMVQIQSDGSPWRWNTNEAWLYKRTDIAAVPEFHFILPQNLDQTMLTKTYGVPTKIVLCDGQAVWVYDRTISWRSYK